MSQHCTSCDIIKYARQIISMSPKEDKDSLKNLVYRFLNENMTIRELAQEAGVSEEEVLKILPKEGLDWRFKNA